MYAKNIYETSDKAKEKAIQEFCEGYKDYISFGKTERLATAKSEEIAKAYGYKKIDEYKTLKAGDKVYFINRNKNICLYLIGKKPITEGLRVLGAHIDSPRLDVKQNPLYEDSGFALLDTHYYGGVKKYQWVAIPLAIHGVVCKKDGTTVDVNIGESDKDPVFGIGDLLIHLSQNQMEKTLGKAIEGEKLDVTVGSIPLKKEEKDAVKANVLKLLKSKYQIEEEDFLSSELEVVPSGKARDYGLDRSMIMGYGHDDRVCAYTSLMALLETKETEYTACCILVDKEEIGSVGATGAHSYFFENTIAELLNKVNEKEFLAVRKTLENSKMLSSDVSAALDPLYPEVNETKNTAFLNKGICFNKFTGSRGKSGSNDADAEYIAWVRNVMDSNDIHYQTSELGKVDQGGGGTIAYILGNTTMQVMDAGIAVLNMHAPFEVVSKADVYEGYLAYKAFIKG